MNKKSVEKDKEFFLILLAQGASASEEGVCLIGEYLLFLTKYSFLLTDKPQDNFFSKRQIPPHGELFSQNPNGARYLDPKYSRWISVDPALGEYVPVAGKSNEADKLPGMGGIYNSVNLSLYHYAGNNPVRYVDPDGEYPYTAESVRFIKEVFGYKGTKAIENVSFNAYPNNHDAFSLTFLWNTKRTIFLNIPCYENPMATNSTRNDFAHEVFHQVQYTNQFDPDIKIGFYDETPFQVLVMEKILGDITDLDLYDYGDLSQYNKLSEFTNYEAQAQMAGDFAALYYQARYVDIELSSERIQQLKESSRIFENSGIVTEATRWVKENF